ncbi:MAG: quinoprotein relay system zinc metallohydrolase 2 [Rhodocyclaceae bacterium]|jgi:quinoprotein relay system zinc metallohydrolase 2|nr:MAG: quinoprotein relay system zinc metallohydrolase 2 [Rhodocyclaceae bacterium]
MTHEFVSRLARHLAAVIAFAGSLHAPAVAAPLTMRQVAPGVFVHFGAHEEATRENLGSIANIGFVVGEKCVAVIDSGGSAALGARLRESVRAATKLPVCFVINTHMHPDHVFGNAAFSDEPGVEFVGHAKLGAALAARERGYLERLRQEMGDAGAGTRVVMPTLTVGSTRALDLGGRILDLRAWPTAHTDNDLTVLDAQTGTLWSGDLLFVERIPSIDGSLIGWLKVLGEMRKLDPKRVVSGHGDAGENWRPAVDRMEEYLAAVRNETRTAIKARRTIQAAIVEVGATQRGKWLLFDDYHKRNVTAAYAELEWED